MVNLISMVVIVFLTTACQNPQTIPTSGTTTQTTSNLDTCPTIEKGCDLFLGFRNKMTRKEVEKHLDELTTKSEITSDLKITFSAEDDVTFDILPEFDGCYLRSILLTSRQFDSGIDKLLQEKYGPGQTANPTFEKPFEWEEALSRVTSNSTNNSSSTTLYWETQEVLIKYYTYYYENSGIMQAGEISKGSEIRYTSIAYIKEQERLYKLELKDKEKAKEKSKKIL